MVLEAGTVSIILDGGGKSVPIFIEDGIEGIARSSIAPQSVFASGGGPGKNGDFEPGFAFAEQRTWEGGRALEFFSDDQTRYLDSKGAWTLTPGKLAPAPQWFFGKGYRPNLSEFVLPGNVTWRPLYDEHRYVDRKITPTATITADKCYVWVRKIGYPQGNLTLELCSDDGSGAPDTVLKTVTVDTDTITDYLSVFQVFDWTTTQSLTGGTAYHIKIYGATTDNRDSHWEVATDADTADGLVSDDGSSWTATTYSLYYRIVGADIKAHHIPFVLDQALYFCSIYRDATASKVWLNGARGKATAGAATTLTDSNAAFGTSSEYVGALVKIIRGTGAYQVREIASHTGTVLTVTEAWDINPSTDSEYFIYQTNRFTECATTGLGVVTDVRVYNNIAHFAQGESVNIRKMRWNPGAATPAHEYADDGTNKSTLLEHGSVDGTMVLWKGNNSSTAVTVARGAVVAWGASHTFGSAINAGDVSAPMTNLVHFTSPSGATSRLAVFKTSQNGYIDNDKWYVENLQISSFPEATNGVAAIIHGLYKYFNWSNSVERQYGEAVDDIDPNREAGMPRGRQGYISCVESHPVGVIMGIDAGPSGYSSVLFFDNFNYHEIFRSPEAGKRIRSIIWQVNEGGKKYLWISCGDDLIYMEFPRMTRNPLEGEGQKFMHEFSLVSATYDQGNSSLYKVWKDIAFVTKNLDGIGVKAKLDYQTDTDIDSSTWTQIEAAEIRESPSDVAELFIGEAQQLRLRIRAYTDDATIPPIFNSITVKSTAQLPDASEFVFWGTFGPIAEELDASSEDTLKHFREKRGRARVFRVADCVRADMVNMKCLVTIVQDTVMYSTDGRDNVKAQFVLRSLDG